MVMDFHEPGHRTGVVLLCNERGIVQEVIRDDLDVVDASILNQPLTFLVDRGSFSKTLHFLVELRRHSIAFNWELNVPHKQNKILTLHFAGLVVEQNLFIIGARDNQNILLLYEDLMQISNEQTNKLRLALKERSELIETKTKQDQLFYDEVTRLNNELITLQRELGKKNIEQRQLNEELKHLNELKNKFLGMAAHDLRGPLGNIKLGISLFREIGPDLSEEEQDTLLRDIFNQAHYMLALVDDLLDVSQIESGKLVLKPEPIDLKCFLKEAVEHHAKMATPKRIQVVMKEIPEGTAVVDRVRLRQVIDNLISNAVKFSPLGSKVTINAQKNENHWRINVQDEGPGIKEEERQYLFKDFSRLSSKPTGGEKSTGLGLAITRRVIEAHQGQIGVDSEGGKGSTFWFTVPRNEMM